jgi:hypothetical protein
MGNSDRWIVKMKSTTSSSKTKDVCESMQQAPEIVAMSSASGSGGGSSGAHCHSSAHEVGVRGVQADRPQLDKLRSQHAQDIEFIEPDYEVGASFLAASSGHSTHRRSAKSRTAAAAL